MCHGTTRGRGTSSSATTRTLIDIHVVELDEAVTGFTDRQNGEMFPAGSLDGIGSIGGHPVRCIASVHLVAFHTGYPWRPQDIHVCRPLAAGCMNASR